MLKPFVIGKFHSINELDSMTFSYKKDLRERIRFLIIDDEPFVYLEKLRNAKFNVTQIPDITDLHAIAEYNVVICDINGVGNTFSSEYGGAFVLSQMKQLYPDKQYAYYSGKPIYTTRMMALLGNITSITKDAEIDQWTSYFDKFIENSANPRFAWKQMKELCVANDVATFSIARMEDEYVRVIKKNPALLSQIHYEDYQIKDELQTLLKSIISNLIASLVVATAL